MRRRYSREQWLSWIVEQRSSGLSVSAFCAGNGVGENSFYRWKAKLIAEDAISDQLALPVSRQASPSVVPPAPDSASSMFVPLSVVESAKIEIELPCGAIVRVPQDDRAIGCVLQVLMAVGSGQLDAGGAAC